MSSDAITIVLAIAGTVNGLLVGAMLRDWAVRKSELAAFLNSNKEHRETMGQIANKHNELVTQMTRMQDKVNAHEVRLIGGMPKAAATK